MEQRRFLIHVLFNGILALLLSWAIFSEPSLAAPPQQGGDLQSQALALFNEGKALGAAGQNEAALAKFEAALQLYQTIDDRFGQAISLMVIGFYREEIGDYPGALSAYQASLPLWRQVGDQTYEEATLYFLGGVHYHLGQYDQALDFYQQDLALVRVLGDVAGEGQVLNNLGGVYDELGQYEQAMALYQRALEIHRQTGGREAEAITLNNLGELFASQADYRPALAYYQQALSFRREVGDRVGEATTLNNIGAVYGALGDFETAIDYFQQALAGWRATGDRSGQALALNNLGETYTNLREDDLALETYQAALQLRQELGEQSNQAVTLNNIAGLYKRQGQFEKALAAYQEALAIFQTIGDQRRAGMTRNNLGAVHDDLGQPERALEYYQQTLTSLDERNDPLEVSIALANAGLIYEQTGDPAQASAHYERAIALIESIRDSLGVEDLATAFAADLRQLGVYEQLINLLWQQGDYEAAFEYIERARARAFLDQFARGAIDVRTGAAADLLRREQALSKELEARRAQLARLRSRPPAEQDAGSLAVVRSELAALEDDYAALLLELKVQNPEYATLISADVAALPDIQADLDPTTVLVEYFVTETRTLAFVITRDSVEPVSLEAGRSALVETITAFRDFPDLGASPSPALQQLYGWLIEPLEPYLDRPALVVVPHNVLHYLPFVALTNGERYLVDDYLLTTLPSASVLPLLQDKRKPPPNSALVLGNPATVDSLPALPFARQEAERVAALFGAQPLLAQQATESAVWSKAGETGILHLAAHGTYNTYNPLFSAIHLAADERADGRLEVHELYGLDLSHQTDLVVLSACETAIGELSAGDEVVGLNRVFFYAGAPSVIASLWSVDDEATASLMERFYTHLRDGMSKAGALRQAQIEVRAAYPHPFYWSGFVLSGDAGEIKPPADGAAPPADDTPVVGLPDRVPPPVESENEAGRSSSRCLSLLMILGLVGSIGLAVGPGR